MIDTVKVKNSLIYKELSDVDKINWFDLKQKKFLHTVDTFYYSVKLAEDFTSDTVDESVLRFRNMIMKLKMKIKDFSNDVPQFYIPNIDKYLNVCRGVFSMYYTLHFECPECFDIFWAPVVPGNENGDSVTSEIIVQIRSAMLWQYGMIAAYEISMDYVKALCDMHDFHIIDVKENRTDYCFHSNYLSNPEKFFSQESFDAMRCTRLGDYTSKRYYDKGSSSSGFNYLSRGSRGDKTFLRIYNKTKEVIEENYKPFFLKTWLFNNLINRYDYYVYEKCYLHKNWINYQYIARLYFYSEYGTDSIYISECKRYISMYETCANNKVTDSMIHLAELLTPAITIIINVEFQLMRKSSKSYKLYQLKDNSDKGVEQRIYDFHDNHRLIIDYLTSKIFRLVEKNGDINKSRRPDCPFWSCLRSTKYIDAPAVPNGLKMTRIYNRQLNADKLKRDIINKSVTYGMYIKGKNNDEPLSDIMLSLISINDNDIQSAKRYKEKKAKLLNDELLSFALSSSNCTDKNRYMLFDSFTGEFYSPDYIGGVNGAGAEDFNI